VIKTQEMMNGFIKFGRKDILDFVAQSRDVKDAVTYLRMELEFEIDRITAFTTVDSRSFQRKNEVIEEPAAQNGFLDSEAMLLPPMLHGVHRKGGSAV